MYGRIKVFFEKKGYGFINTEQNNDYFFHISDVKTTTQPYVGMEVTFDIVQSPKGSIAKNICVAIPITKKNFIIIGNTRIKLSNIKSYSILDDSELIEDPNGDILISWSQTRFINKVYGEKLVVETFQGDSFTFKERNGIDVRAKLAELDDYLCN